MQNIQNLTIDINKKPFQTITANTGEVASRFVRINIVDKSIPVDLTGATVSLYAKKPDGTKVFNSVEVEDAKQGIVLAELTSQILIVEGMVKLTLLLIKNNSKLCSKQFLLNVESSGVDDEAIESSNEFGALTKSLTKVDEWNKYFEETSGKIEEKYTERLNSSEEKISALDTKKADKNEIFSMANMGQDIKEAITGGSVAIVGSNMINAKNIIDGVIEEEKTSFIYVDKINLFNKSDVDISVGFISDMGEIAVNDNYRTSGFIRIKSGTIYKTKANLNINHAFYNASYELVSVAKTNLGVISVPFNAEIKYLKFSFSTTDLETIMLAEDEYPTRYIDYNNYSIEFNAAIEKRIKSIAKGVHFSDAITPLDTDFLTIETTNYLNLNKINHGYIGYDGEVVYREDVIVSDFIKVNPGDTVITDMTWQGGFYNKSKEFISNVFGHTVDEPITVPNNIGYIRVAGASTSKYIYLNEKPSEFSEYKDNLLLTNDNYVNSIRKQLGELYNKKWLVIGDSISANTNGYHKYISDRCGCNILNHAVSGSRISKVEGEDCMTERIDNMPSDVDIVTIFGGTNDYGSQVPLGSMSDRDLTTFYGACHLAISKILKKYHGKKIGIITPMRRENDLTWKPVTLKEYADVVVEVAQYYSIPVLNLYLEGGLNPNIDIIKANYVPDGLHPSQSGCDVLSRPIEAFLKRI